MPSDPDPTPDPRGADAAAFEFADVLARLAAILSGYRSQLIGAGFTPEEAGAMSVDMQASLLPLFFGRSDED